MAERLSGALHVLHALQQNPTTGPITSARVQELTGCSDTAARRALRDLRRAGVLVDHSTLHPENLDQL